MNPKPTPLLPRFIDLCIDRRAIVMSVIGALSLVMLFFAVQVRIGTNFADMLPADHPYVAVHNKYKATYGGANAVTIVLEVEQGDIFRTEVLQRLRTATLELRKVDGVNPEQIISLASRKLTDVRASTEGLETKSLMFPNVPTDEVGIEELKQRVLKNGLVYGSFVSRDLKAALINVDFYDHLLNPATVFPQIRAITESLQGPGIKVRMVGEPILAGWVAYYLPETVKVLAATLALLCGLLFLISRTWRGTLLPALAGLTSATWALGVASLFNIQFDPLVIVVAFLITARSISHSVQLVTRFDDEVLAGAKSAIEAAKKAMLGLFKPGMLGVIADAGCMIVVVLTPIPLMKKVAIIGTVWICTIAISSVVSTPILLSWAKLPLRCAHPINLMPALNKLLTGLARLATSVTAQRILLGSVSAIFILSGWYALRLTVGDANLGSPILRRDSEYNRDAAEINRRFPGADKMFVVVTGEKEDDIKKPEFVRTMLRFQKYMEAQPEVGATLSVVDLIPIVKRVLRDGNHRYEEFGRSQIENGELLYLLGTGGADPSDMDRFADSQFKSASLTLYFRDHQGDTVRTAIARIKEFIASNHVEGLHMLLAGGYVGVLAAVNEVILAGQIESIALALLVLVLCCAVVYRSLNAGLFFMVPVILSNTLTFSFMAWQGIGMNINTLPIAALGIGLGVDYAFYIVDDIKEELRRGRSMNEAIALALAGAGKGVVVTAGTLIFAVAMWSFSSLRFQSEMALLMAVWLMISAASALILMPAMVALIKPKFIVGAREALHNTV
ncbi:MAG: efflux RND transporter permease subunit [Betaproteobacteria bacterium]